MNNNIKANVTAATNSVVEKYTNNVIIRMSDFYPEAVGGQEYCMVTKKIYSELLCFKAIEEGIAPAAADPDNTPTVIIELRDFYPRSRSKEQYIEITRDEFNKLLKNRAALEFEMNRTDSSSEKVTVRTRDFYPFLCSSKEYTELEKNTYEMLLRYMTLSDHKGRGEDPFCKSTVLVKIRINDFFPDAAEEDAFNEIPVEIFMELLRYKGKSINAEEMKRKNTVMIRVADYYPHNCSKEEYCSVSVAVFEQLKKNRYEDEARRIHDSRYLNGFEFDEESIGEMDGLYTESNEKTIYYTILLRNLFAPYGEMMTRRALMYFIEGCPVKAIAVAEKIGERAVRKSLKKIFAIVKNAGSEYFGLD